MLRLSVIIGDIFIIASIMNACSAEPAPAASTKRFTEADAGRAIDLRVGDTLEITLPGNPTTGYDWEVSSGDVAILRPIGEPTFEPSSTSIGSGGKITLRFQAVATGRMDLKLIYHRSFEKDTPPAKTFEVTVAVR